MPSLTSFVPVGAIELRALDHDFLAVGTDQLDGPTGRGLDLDLAAGDADLPRRGQLDRAARTEDQLRLLDQPDGNGVGPARIGLKPVAQPDRHPLDHRAPALGHHRPDGDKPLHVGHLADPAVLGQRVADDEQVLVDRLVAGHEDHVAAGPRLRLFVSNAEGLDRPEHLGLGVHDGVDSQPLNVAVAVAPPGGRPAIHVHFAAVAGLAPGRSRGQQFLPLRSQGQIEQGQKVHAARVALKIGGRAGTGTVGLLVDEPCVAVAGDLVRAVGQVATELPPADPDLGGLAVAGELQLERLGGRGLRQDGAEIGRFRRGNTAGKPGANDDRGGRQGSRGAGCNREHPMSPRGRIGFLVRGSCQIGRRRRCRRGYRRCRCDLPCPIQDPAEHLLGRLLAPDLLDGFAQGAGQFRRVRQVLGAAGLVVHGQSSCTLTVSIDFNLPRALCSVEATAPTSMPRLSAIRS